jgi:hypothetical protein
LTTGSDSASNCVMSIEPAFRAATEGGPVPTEMKSISAGW